MTQSIFTTGAPSCGRCSRYDWESGKCCKPTGKNYQREAAILDCCPAFENERKEAGK